MSDVAIAAPSPALPRITGGGTEQIRDCIVPTPNPKP